MTADVPILILVACHDLMVRSRVETALRHMGLTALPLRASDDPAAVMGVGRSVTRPAAVIVDLALGHERWLPVVAAARAADPPLPVLAFGAHVDRASQAEARAAGCDIVVANSRLSRELPALVQRLLSTATPR